MHMDVEQQKEVWQMESQGQIFDTNFEELTFMIEHGELLRMDRVRKGDLRWIEAGRVPALLAVFNAKEGEGAPRPVITLTKLGPTSVPEAAARRRTDLQPDPEATHPLGLTQPTPQAEPMCSMHDDLSAIWVCGTCVNNFCKSCPTSYGSNVKICPFCGAMCNKIEKVEEAKAKAVSHSAAMSGGFGFEDFVKSLAYPFKFKTSLLLGAVMYAFFSIGTGAAGFGGFFMLSAALVCFLLTNTLWFGVLANTIENFAQGKVDSDFMPSFEDFSIWDDVVHPFFLWVGVFIVTTGPLILLAVFAWFFLHKSVSDSLVPSTATQTNAVQKVEMNPIPSDAAQMVAPDISYAARAAKQSEEVRALLNKQADKQKQRIADAEKEVEGSAPYGLQSQPHSISPEAEEYARKTKAAEEARQNAAANLSANTAASVVDESEQNVMRANETIQQTQKAQLEATLGKTPETRSAEQWAMIKQIIGYGIIFLLIGGLCLLWGLFYFPAACAVAGYTRSFTATLNPSVGFDTIKHLGVDYVKILLMGLAIIIMLTIVSGILAIVFIPFDLPGMGNLPAKVVGSLFGFYFSVVFSCVLGLALYKASDRLRLPS
jgi:hypothetical protein